MAAFCVCGFNWIKANNRWIKKKDTDTMKKTKMTPCQQFSLSKPVLHMEIEIFISIIIWRKKIYICQVIPDSRGVKTYIIKDTRFYIIQKKKENKNDKSI